MTRLLVLACDLMSCPSRPHVTLQHDVQLRWNERHIYRETQCAMHWQWSVATLTLSLSLSIVVTRRCRYLNERQLRIFCKSPLVHAIGLHYHIFIDQNSVFVLFGTPRALVTLHECFFFLRQPIMTALSLSHIAATQWLLCTVLPRNCSLHFVLCSYGLSAVVNVTKITGPAWSYTYWLLI